MGVTVPVFENSKRTVDDICSLLTRYDFEPIVRGTLASFATVVDKNRDEADQIAFAMFDLQTKAKSLAGINLPDTDTFQGKATGIALAEMFFLGASSPFRNHPVVLMTGRKVTPAIQDLIDTFLQRHPGSIFFRKDAEIDIFERFVQARYNAIHSSEKVQHLTTLEKEEFARFFYETCNNWRLTDLQMGRVLGISIPEESNLEAHLAHVIKFSSEDAFERMKDVVELKLALESFFPEDLSSQIEWLSAEQETLSGRSAMSLLITGESQNLASVLELVRRMTG